MFKEVILLNVFGALHFKTPSTMRANFNIELQNIQDISLFLEFAAVGHPFFQKYTFEKCRKLNDD